MGDYRPLYQGRIDLCGNPWGCGEQLSWMIGLNNSDVEKLKCETSYFLRGCSSLNYTSRAHSPPPPPPPPPLWTHPTTPQLPKKHTYTHALSHKVLFVMISLIAQKKAKKALHCAKHQFWNIYVAILQNKLYIECTIGLLKLTPYIDVVEFQHILFQWTLGCLYKIVLANQKGNF